jgi:hypothetical protein
MKKFDVTLIRYRGIEVDAETEEQARKLAEEEKDSNEIVGVIEEIKSEEEIRGDEIEGYVHKG